MKYLILIAALLGCCCLQASAQFPSSLSIAMPTPVVTPGVVTATRCAVFVAGDSAVFVAGNSAIFTGC